MPSSTTQEMTLQILEDDQEQAADNIYDLNQDILDPENETSGKPSTVAAAAVLGYANDESIYYHQSDSTSKQTILDGAHNPLSACAPSPYLPRWRNWQTR